MPVGRRGLNDPLLLVLVVSTLLGLVRLVEWLDPVEPQACAVTSVIDGDSVVLTCAGSRVEARLLGLDAPEMHGACQAENAAARAARAALQDLTRAARTVAVTRQGTDRYGRALVTLWLDGRDAAETLIAQGHARAYAGGARGGWCG